MLVLKNVKNRFVKYFYSSNSKKVNFKYCDIIINFFIIYTDIIFSFTLTKLNVPF